MEVVILLIGIVAVFLYVMIRGTIEEKNNRKKYREHLRSQYGNFPDREYSSEELKNITRLFEHIRDNNCVDYITWNDLEMDRMYILANHTQSAAGAEYLYYMLRSPKLKKDGTDKLEKHISYLMDNGEERLDLQMILHDLGTTGRFSMFDYLDYLDNLGSRSNIPHILSFAALLLSIAVIFVSASKGIILLIIVSILNIINYVKEKNQVTPYVTSFAYIMRMLSCADKILKSPLTDMADYKEELNTKNHKLDSFRKNSTIVLQMNNSTGNPADIVFDYIKMMTHIDIIQFNRMLNQVLRMKQEIQCLALDIGYIDAVISIGAFRKSLNYYCVPELCENKDEAFSIKEGFHPFITNPVPNSFEQRRGMLITGSNASGKSTFLKMVAVNAILAQTINTCAAKSYHGSFFRIYSSMALRDNLDNGESYYIVEIKALKRIVDVAEKTLISTDDIPLLCFVDEVLRGTNTVERIAASAQILEYLSQKGIYCFAATHDIELTHLLENSYDNYHFEEEVKDGDMLFSYHLLPERAQTRNAIRLLELIGFSDNIIQKADKLAGNFLQTGKWDKA